MSLLNADKNTRCPYDDVVSGLAALPPRLINQ